MHALRGAAALLVPIVAAAPAPPEFGHTLRERFLLDNNYTNLNHGSYGSTPRVVLEAQHRWQLHVESLPERWFRFSDQPSSLVGSTASVRARLAQYIGAASPDDVVLVDGASGGVNAVLRSVRLPPSSSILYLNTAYEMVVNTVRYVHDHDGGRSPVQVNITIPSTDADILNAVELALEKDPSVKLASFSHITSFPAVVLPVKQLAQICHKRGVMVLIDGAHALGQISINVQDISADFYVANGHKWLYSPKGSALIWVAPDKQDLIHPNVINYEGAGPTSFQMQFSYTGTKDYSSFLAMSAALEFRAMLGGEERIMSYMHQLASQGGAVLAEAWETEKLVEDSRIGAMVNVRLPDRALPCCSRNLSNEVFLRNGTWIPVAPWQGRCYVRVSAQIYNELSDFRMAASAISEVLDSGLCQSWDCADSNAAILA